MRLLNVKTLQLETFYSGVPAYAALSHTWGDEEVTFQDVTAGISRDKKGWSKIVESSIQAAKHRCDYIWIDTCCIDKSSSAEISEAINSMFRWYRKSKVCFGYLEDVSAEPGWTREEDQVKIVVDASGAWDERLETPVPVPHPAVDLLPNSRWFKRGWILQELIAPRIVYFYDSSWNEIGEKRGLEKVISETTGIDSHALRDCRSLYTKSIARRMSWASYRQTTRIEDLAYCIIGIFNINMLLLYGEGGNAFIRVQEAIMNRIMIIVCLHGTTAFPSPSLKVGIGGVGPLVGGVGLLAPHPVAFKNSATIFPHSMKTEPYSITNIGLRICLRLLEHNPPADNHTHFAILQCGYSSRLTTALAIPIAQISTSKASGSASNFYRSSNRDFIEVEFSQATLLRNQNVYFLPAGTLTEYDNLDAYHRCWLRNYGQELSVTFHEAQYREYPTRTVRMKNRRHGDSDHWDSDHWDSGYWNSGYWNSGYWNYESNSMSWAESWGGLRVALLFSQEGGPAIVLTFTFKCLSDQEGQIGMDVRIKWVSDHTNKTFRFEDTLLGVRIKKEVVFDEEMFILDCVHSVVKREDPEITTESLKEGNNIGEYEETNAD